MLTRAQGRAQRAALMREIAREERQKQRRELDRLVRQRREAHADRKGAMRAAKERCRTARREVRSRLKAERARLLAELRDNTRSAKAAAKEACALALADARTRLDAPELVALFERVKGRIRGSPHQSRTEAFLHYAEEHPSEVLAAVDDRTEALIAELEAKEHRARTALRRPVPRKAIEAQIEEAPF